MCCKIRCDEKSWKILRSKRVLSLAYPSTTSRPGLCGVAWRRVLGIRSRAHLVWSPTRERDSETDTGSAEREARSNPAEHNRGAAAHALGRAGKGRTPVYHSATLFRRAWPRATTQNKKRGSVALARALVAQSDMISMPQQQQACCAAYGRRQRRAGALWVWSRNENGSDTNGYHWYYICFHIFGRIRIRIRIISTMSDKIRLDVDIINIRFKYSDTDTVSDIKHSNSDTDRSQPL